MTKKEIKRWEKWMLENGGALMDYAHKNYVADGRGAVLVSETPLYDEYGNCSQVGWMSAAEAADAFGATCDECAEIAAYDPTSQFVLIFVRYTKPEWVVKTGLYVCNWTPLFDIYVG